MNNVRNEELDVDFEKEMKIEKSFVTNDWGMLKGIDEFEVIRFRKEVENDLESMEEETADNNFVSIISKLTSLKQKKRRVKIKLKEVQFNQNILRNILRKMARFKILLVIEKY
jgi:hypothetical protein